MKSASGATPTVVRPPTMLRSPGQIRAFTNKAAVALALDTSGGKLNVNADTAAAAIARMLNAEKLVFLSDVPGIYMDAEDPGSLLPHLQATRVRELIAEQ